MPGARQLGVTGHGKTCALIVVARRRRHDSYDSLRAIFGDWAFESAHRIGTAIDDESVAYIFERFEEQVEHTFDPNRGNMKHLLSALAVMAFATLTFTAAQAAAPPKPTAGFDVGSTHFDKYGAGEPALILIPGLTDSAVVWEGTIAEFAPKHTVYALTLAGFGGRTPSKAPLIDKAVAHVTALISQEHLDKPVIIGHSLGGFTVIRIAQEHPDVIRGAIAVDGLPIFPGMEKLPAAQRQAIGARMAAQMASSTPEQFQAISKAQIVPNLTQAKNVDAVAAAGAGADPAASGQYMQELLAADLRPGLQNVTVPLLELVPFDATLDPLNPQSPFKSAAEKLAYYQSLLAGAKTARLQLVENSRHFIMYDQPQAFYDAVSSFLRTLP